MYVDEASRFPSRVSELLKDSEGKNIKVLNGGFGGSHTLHSQLSILAKSLPLKPKRIVLMHAINDLTTLAKTQSYWEGPTYRQIIQIEGKPQIHSIFDLLKSIKDLLFKNTWPFVRPLFTNLLFQTPLLDEWHAFRHIKAQPDQIVLLLESEFKPAIESFIDVSRNWGIEPVIMTQVNRLHENDAFIESQFTSLPQSLSYNYFIELYRQTNQIIRDIAKEKDVLLIDLDKEIKGSSEYVFDPVHLNNAGSELVAEEIANKLSVS